MNRAKAKGTAFETAVVRYLADHGFPEAQRLALSGGQDRGDIDLGHGVPIAVECKNRKALDLAGAVDEAVREAANAGVPLAVAIIKRPRKGAPGEAYAVMPLRLWVELASAIDPRAVG